MTKPRTPTVVNVRGRRHPYTVLVARPSKWGNPFRVGRDGQRSEVIEKYEAYVRDNEVLLRSLAELDGAVLGCYCAPLDCHGDVLVKLFDEFVKNCLVCERVFSWVFSPVQLCDDCVGTAMALAVEPPASRTVPPGGFPSGEMAEEALHRAMDQADAEEDARRDGDVEDETVNRLRHYLSWAWTFVVEFPVLAVYGVLIFISKRVEKLMDATHGITHDIAGTPPCEDDGKKGVP